MDHPSLQAYDDSRCRATSSPICELEPAKLGQPAGCCGSGQTKPAWKLADSIARAQLKYREYSSDRGRARPIVYVGSSGNVRSVKQGAPESVTS
jgi:hypothetical protein